MITSLRSSDIKENERVELSGYFQVYSHGNGIQLVRDNRTYSIVPVLGRSKWEVNDYQKESSYPRFDDLNQAIEYVLEEESVEVKVHGPSDFYESLERGGPE